MVHEKHHQGNQHLLAAIDWLWFNQRSLSPLALWWKSTQRHRGWCGSLSRGGVTIPYFSKHQNILEFSVLLLRSVFQQTWQLLGREWSVPAKWEGLSSRWNFKSFLQELIFLHRTFWMILRQWLSPGSYPNSAGESSLRTRYGWSSSLTTITRQKLRAICKGDGYCSCRPWWRGWWRCFT